MTGPQYGLAIDERLFAELMSELARRGNGERESGAFLLARASHVPDEALRHQVIALAYYDDLDPQSLTGGITFSADGYTALAARCRRDSLHVVGDIHTHPGSNVKQSTIDTTHPMTALPGHIALIAPRYARDTTGLADLGVHVLQDGGQWASFYGRDTAQVVTLPQGMLPVASQLLAAARHLGRLIRSRGHR